MSDAKKHQKAAYDAIAAHPGISRTALKAMLGRPICNDVRNLIDNKFITSKGRHTANSLRAVKPWRYIDRRIRMDFTKETPSSATHTVTAMVRKDIPHWSGTLTAKQIAERIGINHRTVGATLREMVDAGELVLGGPVNCRLYSPAKQEDPCPIQEYISQRIAGVLAWLKIRRTK